MMIEEIYAHLLSLIHTFPVTCSVIALDREFLERLIWPVRQTRLCRLGVEWREEDVQPILRHFNLFNWNFICFALEINCVSGRINQTAVHIRMNGQVEVQGFSALLLSRPFSLPATESSSHLITDDQIFNEFTFFRRGHLSLLALLKWTADMVHLLFDNHQRFFTQFTLINKARGWNELRCWVDRGILAGAFIS